MVTHTHVITITDVPISGRVAMNDCPSLLGSATMLSATITAGTNVSHTWDFGDEAFGSGAVVSHSYPFVGMVTATVTGSNSVNLLTAPIIINVIEPGEKFYPPLILKGLEA